MTVVIHTPDKNQASLCNIKQNEFYRLVRTLRNWQRHYGADSFYFHISVDRVHYEETCTPGTFSRKHICYMIEIDILKPELFWAPMIDSIIYTYGLPVIEAGPFQVIL